MARFKDLEGLRRLIARERDSALREMLREGRRFKAEVLDVSKEVLDLECREARFFEAGDVVGWRQARGIGILGTVLSAEPDILTVYMQKPVEEPQAQPLGISEGRRLEIFEAEPLIAYDLQLDLLNAIELGELESEAPALFFGQPRLPDLSKAIVLQDRFSVDREFELDDSQCEAVEAALSIKDGELLLIIGPPGTGKTRVIQKASYLLMERGEKVLVASHTNRAVDNALEKLPVERSLRVGRPEKVLPHLKKYMLSYKARSGLGEALERLDGEIKELTKERWQMVKHLRWLKEQGQPIDVSGRVRRGLKVVKQRLGELYGARNRLLKKESERLVAEAPIIGSTLVKSQLYPLSNVSFDTVFIDECSQASATLALLGMVKAKKWVLIGDHKQLLPIFKTVRDERVQEELSAFTSLLKKYGNRSLWLRRHYRSNSEIIGFASRYVYEGKITPSVSCSNLRIAYERNPGLEPLDPNKPVVFIHCNGEQVVDEERSVYNEAEKEVCVALVRELLASGVRAEDIGVITPYRAQKKVLMSELRIQGLEINTVDAFQGREKDVIIFSLTATEGLRFASNPNRLNVALTRPKYKLIVVGNGRSIVKDRELLINRFLEYVHGIGKRIYDWEKRAYIA